MVKTPRTRHSKPHRAPVTIDLEVNEPEAVASEASSPEHTLQASPIGAGTTSKPESLDASTREMAFEQPVEDRIEEEAAVTGRQQEFEPRRPAEPVHEAPARGGWGSHLAAGLIGGLIAAGGAWLLQPARDSAGLDMVTSDIAAMRSQIEALKASGADFAGLSGAVEQLRAEVAAVRSAAQSNGADAGQVAALADKITRLETTVGGLAAAGSPAQEMESRMAAIEQSIGGLTAKVDAQAAQPKIALAIAAAGLKSALERGAPFTAELDTLAAIAPDAPQLDALRSHAAEGVASRGDIAKAFPAAADAMVAAARPVDENAGFFQRLLTSAESVVKVRPVGEVQGEDAASRVARMEVAVNAGDFDKALAEYDALPEAAKAAGSAIASQIKARVEVEKLSDQLISEAMRG